MEIQLQELIEQIKKEGVEAAEAQAVSILESAKAQAEKIISDANAKANKILADAKNENERTVRSGEDAIRQAGRNLLISFRESVTKELNAIIGENVSSVYSSDALSQLIVKAVESWLSKPDVTDISVILGNDDLARLEASLLSGLKAKMLNGVTLKANDNFDGGFRIAINDDGAYYDYSKDAVTDMLSNYLSPKLTALLKEAE
ncbi:MAG: V-type ATP synthase subunit E [Ruminococcaceae bacterium]|nr:V-type ATP synthase subunit E [Oscillospiraceae bacterium]